MSIGPDWLPIERVTALAERADELGILARYVLTLKAQNQRQYEALIARHSPEGA